MSYHIKQLISTNVSISFLGTGVLEGGISRAGQTEDTATIEGMTFPWIQLDNEAGWLPEQSGDKKPNC